MKIGGIGTDVLRLGMSESIMPAYESAFLTQSDANEAIISDQLALKIDQFCR